MHMSVLFCQAYGNMELKFCIFPSFHILNKSAVQSSTLNCFKNNKELYLSS